MASQQVEDHLLAECAKWNGRTPLLIGAPARLDPKTHFELQLEALVAVGELDEVEATDWRRRLREAGEAPDSVSVDAGLRANVDRYLESLLPDADESEAFDAALDALQDLGLMPEADIDRWFERIAEAEGWDSDDEDADDWTEFVGRELRRVLLGPAEEVDGFRVVALELYDDGVVARFTSRDDVLDPRLELADDAGTDYRPVGGSSGGGPGGRTRGLMKFAPAVPGSATRVVLRRDGRSVELELRQ